MGRKYICTSCYSILAMLRKVKNLLPFHIRKNLTQALVLSKLYYNDILHHSLPEYLTARLHIEPKAAASFVNGKYATTLQVWRIRRIRTQGTENNSPGVTPLSSNRLCYALCINFNLLHFPDIPQASPSFCSLLMTSSCAELIMCSWILKIHLVVVNHTYFKIPQMILQIKFQ